MRCKNCGWDNPENNVQCEKCMAPLDKSEKEPVRANNRTIPVENATANRVHLNATVREKVQESEENGVQENNASFCLSCGYRMRAGETSCPVCGNVASPATEDNDPPPVNAGTVKSAEAPSNSLAETVNPWATNETADQNIPICTLTPVAEDFTEKQTVLPLQYAGNEIVLTRSNTDPANTTVTSQEQAALTYKNGEWFIEDRSAMKTTFVHAGEQKQLKAGDMILMGNRRFIFNKSQEAE